MLGYSSCRGGALGTEDASLFAHLFLGTSRPGNVTDELMGISSLLIVWLPTKEAWVLL